MTWKQTGKFKLECYRIPSASCSAASSSGVKGFWPDCSAATHRSRRDRPSPIRVELTHHSRPLAAEYPLGRL